MNDSDKYIKRISNTRNIILKEHFASLKNIAELSKFLDIHKSHLNYLLYHNNSRNYVKFYIKKKNGVREILAPNSSIKIIQKKLNAIFQKIYQLNKQKYAHGFVLNHSIVTNAKQHCNKRFVLNLDIKDFFPTIHFGRIKGLLQKYPFNLSNDVSIAIANLCTYESKLPQGSPTSPILSNFICLKMDWQLNRLAQEFECDYTRYADDLTFSSNSIKFVNELAYTVNDEKYLGKFGEELKNIIISNGFQINEKKTRLQTYEFRQEVTGITVNKFPNVSRKFVREIRAMLHSWNKYGLEKANTEMYRKIQKLKSDEIKYRHNSKKTPTFQQVLKGKINFLSMVRGNDDSIFLKFKEQYQFLENRDIREKKRNIELNRINENIEQLLNHNLLFEKNSIDILKLKSYVGLDKEPSIDFNFIEDTDFKGKLIDYNKKMVKAWEYDYNKLEVARHAIILIESYFEFIKSNKYDYIKANLSEINNKNSYIPWKIRFDNNISLDRKLKNLRFNDKIVILQILFTEISSHNTDLYWYFINLHQLRNIQSHGNYGQGKWIESIHEKRRIKVSELFENMTLETVSENLECFIKEVEINSQEVQY